MSALPSTGMLPPAIAEAEPAFAPPHIERFIAERGVWAIVVRMPVEMPTAADASRVLGVSEAQVVKTLIFSAGATYCAAVVPGDMRVNKAKLAQLLGVDHVRMASGRNVVEYTGCPPGGVAPIGFLKPMTVVVDARLLGLGFVVGGGGREDLLMCISPQEIVSHNAAKVGRIAEKDEP